MLSTLRSIGINVCAAVLLLICAAGLANDYSPQAAIAAANDAGALTTTLTLNRN